MKLKEFVIFMNMTLLCCGVAVAGISFIDPTPVNNSRIYDNYSNINVSIPVDDLTNFTFNWNGINTTYLNDSCVLHLSFDNNSEIGDSSTVCRDVSSYGNNGSFVNGSTGTWTTDGKWNGAMSFDGVNDYVDCGNAIIPQTNFTVGAWINKAATTDFHDIISQWKSGTPNRFEFTFDGPNNRMIIHISGNNKAHSSVNSIGAGWHYVIATREGGFIKIYINGLQDGVGTDSTTIEQGANLLIGTYSIGYFFNGSIDEVRIYNRALSPAEVHQLYLSNLRKFNESQWYFETNQTDLQNFTSYNYQAFVNNDTINYATDLFNFYVMPYEEILNITSYSKYPETLYTNYTGFLSTSYIVEHSYPLNMSSLAFLMGVNYTLTDDYHSYLKVPANDIADDGIYRAHNRNTTPLMHWENNDTITEGNVWKWAGGTIDDHWIINNSINDTHTWVNVSGVASNVFPSTFYLNRDSMYSSEKTGIEINKGQGVIIKVWDLEQFNGRNYDYWVDLYFDTQLEATPDSPIDIWYCNGSFNPLIDDPTASQYCARMDTWSSDRWVDHITWQPHTNVSYAKSLSAYAGEPATILPDEIDYVYLTSNTVSSKSYILNATNEDSGICNVTFAQTNSMWLRDEVAGTNTAHAYTPSFYITFVRDFLEFTHHIYIANSLGIWGHSDYVTHPIGLSNINPTHVRFNYYWWNGTTDYVMNGTYDENFHLNVTYGFDPDNDCILTHVLSLYDNDYNFVAFINDSLVGSNNDTDIPFDIHNYTSKYSGDCYRFKFVSTDNEASTSVTWSNEFCIKRETWLPGTIDVLKGFPSTISGILNSFLSFLPLFVGILISGFLILVCVGVFSKLKQW